jgi:hypothetical protein
MSSLSSHIHICVRIFPRDCECRRSILFFRYKKQCNERPAGLLSLQHMMTCTMFSKRFEVLFTIDIYRWFIGGFHATYFTAKSLRQSQMCKSFSSCLPMIHSPPSYWGCRTIEPSGVAMDDAPVDKMQREVASIILTTRTLVDTELTLIVFSNETSVRSAVVSSVSTSSWSACCFSSSSADISLRGRINGARFQTERSFVGPKPTHTFFYSSAIIF